MGHAREGSDKTKRLMFEKWERCAYVEVFVVHGMAVELGRKTVGSQAVCLCSKKGAAPCFSSVVVLSADRRLRLAAAKGMHLKFGRTTYVVPHVRLRGVLVQLRFLPRDEI